MGEEFSSVQGQGGKVREVKVEFPTRDIVMYPVGVVAATVDPEERIMPSCPLRDRDRTCHHPSLAAKNLEKHDDCWPEEWDCREVVGAGNCPLLTAGPVLVCGMTPAQAWRLETERETCHDQIIELSVLPEAQPL